MARHAHGGLGIDHTEAIFVVVGQLVIGFPAGRLGIHPSGSAGQDDRHITPGEARVGLQHEGNHARDHRGGCRGAVEVVPVLVLQGGGRHARQGWLAIARVVTTGRTDQKVGARFAVDGPLARGIGCADGDGTQRRDAGVVAGEVVGLGTIAGSEHVDGASASAAVAQATRNRLLPGIIRWLGLDEVPPVVGPPAVVVDGVDAQPAGQGVQHVGIGAGGQRVVTHQTHARGHARAALAIEVACAHHAGHGGAVRAAGVAGQRVGIASAAGVIVVAGIGNDVGEQILVRHLHALVHHGHPHSLALAGLGPDVSHVQILSLDRTGRGAGIVQVPLSAPQRIGAVAAGRPRGFGIAQRTCGGADHPSAPGGAGCRWLVCRCGVLGGGDSLFTRGRLRGNSVLAARGSLSVGGIRYRCGSAGREAACGGAGGGQCGILADVRRSAVAAGGKH